MRRAREGGAMGLIVTGINHRGASVEIREKIAYRPSEVAPALTQLRDEAGVTEAVLLSTCNRTEFYAAETAADSSLAVWRALSARLGTDAEQYGYVHRDRVAVEHLFRVAAGLDSMIVGEAQIQGQVREAWEASREHSGPVLNRLFQTSHLVAGRVRSETGIGRGAASVSSAAVQLAKQIFGSLAGRRAMILGAGEMAELALECLVGEGVRAAIVANRTYERACELADRYGARAIHYDECWASLGDVDVLLCSTASPRPVVTREHVRQGASARRDHPLCILDIALPRDVEPEVRELDSVFLYDLDDLHAVVLANLERRRSELPAAEQIIGAEVERYWSWFAGLAAVPVVTRFRTHMDEVRQRELSDALRRLQRLSPEEQAVVEQFSRSLMNKFLHEPTVRLRAAAANDRTFGIVDTARYLFGLDDPAETDAERVTTDKKGAS